MSICILSIPDSLDFMLYICLFQPLPGAVTLTDACNSVANLCDSCDRQQHMVISYLPLQLDAIAVPCPESCGLAAVCPPSSTNLDMVLGCSQPRYSSADCGSCACTSSEYATSSGELQGFDRASASEGICCRHAFNQPNSSGDASGEAQHVEHPWDELIDSDSQSLPQSPAACSSSSSRAASRSPSVSAPHSLLTWATQQQLHEAAASDQSMPGSKQSSPGQADAALSTSDSEATVPTLHLQLSTQQLTAERELASQHSDALLRPSSASQQLRQQLEQSQQQLLQVQLSHKDRISHAFDQCMSLDSSIPVASRQQQQQVCEQPEGLHTDLLQTSALSRTKLQLPSLLGNESQPGTDSLCAESLPKVERDRHVHWQLQQPVTGVQQQVFCPGQSKHAQHSLATPRVGLEEGLRGSNQGTTRAAAGKALVDKHQPINVHIGSVAIKKLADLVTSSMYITNYQAVHAALLPHSSRS